MPRNSRPVARHRHSRIHVREAAARKREQRLSQIRDIGWSNGTTINLDEIYDHSPHRWGSWWGRREGIAASLTAVERRNLDRILTPESQRGPTVRVSVDLARQLGRTFDRPRGGYRWMGINAQEIVSLDQRLSYGRFAYEPEWDVFEIEPPCTRSALRQHWTRAAESEAVDEGDENRPRAVHSMPHGPRGRYLGRSH